MEVVKVCFADYYWYLNYNESDILWLEESINWDEPLTYSLAPYNPALLITNPYFNNTHYSLSWFPLTSLYDVKLTSQMISSNYSKSFLLLFFMTMVVKLYTKYLLPLSLFLHTDSQDMISTLLYNSPELVLALRDWSVLVFGADAVDASAVSVFDVYQDIPGLKISEFIEFLILTCVYLWLSVLVVKAFKLRPVAQLVDPYTTRLKYYFYSVACENRLQMEATFESFFLAILFFTMMVITFDDDKEEVIEFVNLHLFYLFLAVFVFHLWKYSTHYFSFLDASRVSNSSVMFLLGQFLFDFLNLIGFSLRFVLLMARLNIYDGVDDILDSYYILFIDFDEEEYFLDSLPDFSSFSYFDSDVQDDRSFFQEDENSLAIDLYSIYAVLWGKYVFYLAFILEEFARVGLALFVTFLLIFEINAVNRSFNEDTYFFKKRS